MIEVGFILSLTLMLPNSSTGLGCLYIKVCEYLPRQPQAFGSCFHFPTWLWNTFFLIVYLLGQCAPSKLDFAGPLDYSSAHGLP